MQKEFNVLNSGWVWEDKALFWFALKDVKLSKKVKHYGPSKDRKERLAHFREKWGRVKYEEGVSYVMKDRDFMHAEDLFLHLVDGEYVGSKVGKLTKI